MLRDPEVIQASFPIPVVPGPRDLRPGHQDLAQSDDDHCLPAGSGGPDGVGVHRRLVAVRHLVAELMRRLSNANWHREIRADARPNAYVRNAENERCL